MREKFSFADFEKISSDVEKIDNFDFTHRAVVTFVVQDSKILLIVKKRGLGANKINGPGGKIEKGETPLAAAIRETQEEVGVTPQNLKHLADLFFFFKDGYSMRGYIFVANSCTGELIETDEALPFWCEIEKIPFDKMWEDDIIWLPNVLKGKFERHAFLFEGDKIFSKKQL